MNELELLRQMMKDQRLHFGVGTIAGIALSGDQSILRVLVTLLPENRQIVAEMSFADVSVVTFPEIDDLVGVAFADGDQDEAWVLKIFNTSEEPIPQFAQGGDTVVYPRPGKKLYLGSSTKVGIGRPNIDPTEPLVLGSVLQTYLNAIVTRLDAILDAIEDNPPLTTAPGDPVDTTELVAALELVRTGIKTDKITYLDTAGSNILSQIAFTERGV